MGLILNAPQPAVVPMPAPRLTSYRYWEDYAPKYLRSIRDTVARVIDDQERQRDLFEEAPAAAAFANAPNATVARPTPAAPAAKNETLGNLLSPSQANQFLNCSARWWFKYGAGLADPKGGSLVRGSTVHKCIEHWFKLQMAGAAPEIDDIAEFYEDAWEAQAAEAQFHKDDNIEDLKRSGTRLLRLYLEQVAPEIRPARLEQRVTGEIGGVRVQGWIDQVDVDGRILDVKTAEKSPSGIGSDYAFQLATYRQILPGGNGKARLDTLVNNKTPKLVTIEYEVSVADQFLTVNLYPRVREGIREGLYFPNRNSNLCSRKYCNFADACCKEFGGCVD
jgi:CRISPR/Cas system-associated exonuclease Cas4 (RecB family)